MDEKSFWIRFLQSQFCKLLVLNHKSIQVSDNSSDNSSGGVDMFSQCMDDVMRRKPVVDEKVTVDLSSYLNSSSESSKSNEISNDDVLSIHRYQALKAGKLSSSDAELNDEFGSRLKHLSNSLSVSTKRNSFVLEKVYRHSRASLLNSASSLSAVSDLNSLTTKQDDDDILVNLNDQPQQRGNDDVTALLSPILLFSSLQNSRRITRIVISVVN